MKTIIKKLLSLFLVLALLAPMLPTVLAVGSVEDPKELTAEAYAHADAVFAQIEAMEHMPSKKNATQTEKTDAAVALVQSTQGYVEGSLERNGDAFTWWTDDGIRCAYNPYMHQKRANMQAPADALPSGVYNEPTDTKGGWPAGNEVYLVGPYYGLDDNFTSQYKNEARDIASAIGDTDGYTLYSGTAATVDKVAEAISKGAVVIFDSHGSTDYVNPQDEYDYVTGANYSYLCLSTTNGLTNQDYNDGALYSYYNGGVDAFINGRVIANHMQSQSPAGLLWMAICLGMATDTICEPMREMGVEVVYGYSQSVTFGGDYCFEEVFWDEMCKGSNVAAAVAEMKEEYGQWDCSWEICNACNWDGPYTTIAAARADYAAFPIVVSDEDTHPGQRNNSGFYGADNLQTVRSTYTLYSQYAVTASSNNTAYGTVSVQGSTITAYPAAGYYAAGYTVLSGSATVTQNGNSFYVHAQSDCSVRINFAAKTPVTVQFSGASVPSQNGYAGDEMQLPAVTDPDGYKFLGWTTAPLSAETTEKPEYYTDVFTPTASTTLYALYSYVQPNTGTGTGDYERVTEEPEDWSGEYLIVYEDEVLVFDGSLSTLDATYNYQEIDMYDYTFDGEESDPYRFIIEKVTGGYTIKSASGVYLGRSTNANGIDAGTAVLTNTVTMNSDYSVNIISSGGAILRFNQTSGQMRFRYYKSGTYKNQQPIHLYRKDGTGGTVVYTSSTAPTHEHSFTNYSYNNDATCTADGTETAKCAYCDATHTRTAAGTALGHNHVPTVTAPTCTEDGYTTHKCSRCNDTYVDTYVDALGHYFAHYVYDRNATCTEDGTETAQCERCEETDTHIAVDSKLGHNYVPTVTPPTCTEQGYTTHKCSWCDDSYKDTYVDALGHDYIAVVTPPTASEMGYTTYTCSRCHDTYKDNYTDPTGPSSISSTTAVVSGKYISKIAVNTTVSALLSTLDSGGQYTVTKDGKPVELSANIGTGMAINLVRSGNVLDSVTVIVTGDTNGDGKITITDMLAAKAHVLQKASLTGVYATAGDTNGDDKITITDFIQIKASILGKGTVTPR